MSINEINDIINQIENKIEILYTIYFIFPFIVILLLLLITFKVCEISKNTLYTKEYIKNLIKKSDENK